MKIRHHLITLAVVAAVIFPGYASAQTDFSFDPVQRFAPIHLSAPATRSMSDSPVTLGPPLRPPDTQWIEDTLASMTLDEKIGQMIMPGYSSDSGAADLISTYHVGGFIFQGNFNTAPAVLAATNYLQGVSEVPLLFSTDCEAGLGARFTDATRFPMNMANGAAYDLDLVRQQGAITARECRAIGIQVGFGPVLDVNTEPINPIIGIRSYGDNPTSVSALAMAYVEGANSEGLLCTFKHFPGHGAADGDSHLGLPTINISSADLQSNHVLPYAQLLGAGLGDLVMTAHVWYPVLDPGTTPWPATLSTPALTGILRNQLDYTGCVISDSFAMGGLLEAANTFDGVQISVLAGLDIVLTPKSVADAFNGLKYGVTSQQIPVSRIDASVRRILALKSRAGMPESVTVPVEGLNTVAHPDNTAVAEQMGRKTIAAKLADDVIPVQDSESLGIYVLTGNSTIFYSYPSSVFTDALVALHSNAQVITVPSNPDFSEQATLLTQAGNFDKVIVVSMEWGPRLRRGSQVDFVNSLIATDTPVAYVSFGSPYQWNEFPELNNFLCGFTCHYATQQQMAKVITGDSSTAAHWPVQLQQVISAVTDWQIY